MIADLEKQLRGQPEPPFLAQLRTFADRPWSVYLEWAPRCFIELFDQLGASVPLIPKKENLNFTHFALEVEDIHAFRNEIIANGGGEYLDTEITLGIDQTLQMWMHDPDGNKFELMQYTEKSYQVVGR